MKELATTPKKRKARSKATVIPLAQATIRELPAAKPGQRDTYRFAGADLTGLELRVTDRGVKTLSYLGRGGKGGGPVRVTLGRFSPGLQTAAAIDDKLREAKAAVSKGSNPAEEKRKARSEATVGEAFTAYAAATEKKSAGNDASIFKHHIDTAIGKRRLSAVTPEMVKDLHAGVARKSSARVGRSAGLARTADQAAALLRSVFNFAGRKGEANPAHGIAQRGNVERTRQIEKDEAPLFTEALELLQSADMRDFFLLCLYTGARRGNVMAMKWRDLRLDETQWVIQASESKNGKEQRVMLAQEAVDILEARKAVLETADTIQQFVFPGSGKSGHIEEPKKAWAKVCKGMQMIEALHALYPNESAERQKMKEGLRDNFPRAQRAIAEMSAAKGINVAEHFRGGVDLRIHDLRHTFASWQAGQRTSLLIISKALNHSSTKPTERYTHLMPAPVQEAVSSAVRAIAAAGAEPFKPRIVGLKKS